MRAVQTVFLVLLITCFASCLSTRPIQYVQGQFDTAQLSKYVIRESVIQKADLISIVVYSDNPAATALYNQPSAPGYLVDEKGNIQLQGVGSIHVEGLTKQQLAAVLNSKLEVYLKNPYYNIRLVNYKVTLLGEVAREGTFTVPNEKVNIFEAIALAGGLGIYARRDNVLVIREANDKREFARLDLTDPNVLKSPYYFLQQNDMVMIEQNRNKVANNDQTTVRTISLATSVISTLVFLYTVFK